ncbi:MAG: IS1634 family transposase, partial [Moorella sp. (in: Bacteria)]|nr:IS1634 family transposase [Moorella sp. (in: firmicutes)]
MEVGIDKLELRVFAAGPAALVARMCDVLRIPQIIDSVVEWDPKNCRLSPGLRAKAMVINILVDRRALYDVEKFYQTQDLEVLFGPEAGVRADELNDDALGRALDKIYASDLERLFSMIALNAAALHDAPLTELFTDTTSISVAGAYEGGHGDLFITYGYNKDGRPDLKQFLMGLVVNQEGLPVFA